MQNILQQKNIRHLMLLLVTIVVFCLPFLTSNNYYLSVLVVIGIHAIVVIGLSLLMGYAGQISLGHAAFYGLGAYTSCILTTSTSLSPWLAMLIGAVGTGAVAYIIGRPIFKLREHYLALATLGLGLIVHVIFMEEVDLTGGPSGKTLGSLELGNIQLDTNFKYYFLVWAVALLVLIITNNIVHSRTGRALRAINGSEFAAKSLGVNADRYKLHVFTLSAVYASIAGSLYAHYVTFISPAPFSMMVSIKFLVMAVVGGLASTWGPILGVAGITLLTEGLKTIVPQLMPNAGGEYEIVVYGIILVVIMIFLPEGFVSGLQGIFNKWSRRREQGTDRSPKSEA